MGGLSSWKSRQYLRLLRLRWLLVSLVGLILILIEVAEHSSAGRLVLNTLQDQAEFVSSVLLTGIGLPLSTGLLLGWLESSQRKQRISATLLAGREALAQRLESAGNWQGLIQAMVEFPHTQAPVAGVVLWIVDAKTGRLEQAGTWGFFGRRLPEHLPINSTQTCQNCALVTAPFGHPPKLTACDGWADKEAQRVLARYCLPLVYTHMAIGLLHIYVPAGVTLTEFQCAAMESLTGEMALALEYARQQRRGEQQNALAEAERRKIARDLHDTLAQDLAYLRLKLEAYTLETRDQADAGWVRIERPELVRLCQTADESYEVVRSMLTALDEGVSPDLVATLSAYARAMADQVDFKLNFAIRGRPRQAPPQITRQVLYIFREALNNATRHARCRRVQARLSWKESGLMLLVQDDGQGFDRFATIPSGHVGLKGMHARAEQVGGRLRIWSGHGAGTTIALWVPLATAPASQASPNSAAQYASLAGALPAADPSPANSAGQQPAIQPSFSNR